MRGKTKSKPEVAAAIASLINKSFISVISIDGVAHYRLLDPTLTYAAQKLAQMPEENTVARQHARYYAETLSNRAGNGVAITPEDVEFYHAVVWAIFARPSSPAFPWLARQQLGVTPLASAAAPLFYDLFLVRRMRSLVREASLDCEKVTTEARST